MAKSSNNSFNYFFSNLNVIVILFGYPFIVSIFIPLTGNIEGSSQIITIPFRLFSLGITLITLFLNIRSIIKYPVQLKLFFFFWLLVLIRIFYDIEIRTDYFVLQEYKDQVWITAILFCFIPMISIVKSFKMIDFDICLKYIYWILNIILLLTFFNSIIATSSDERAIGNIALDEISFGQVGVSTIIISIYMILSKKNTKLFIKMFYVLSSILGLFTVLRTGSKGPILALLVVFFFWYSFKERNIIKGVLKFGFLVFMTVVLQSVILFLISITSPVAAFRINEALNGNDMSVKAREESYTWFFGKIEENPLFGCQFARLGYGDYPGYAHNILLDILLGFGIIGLFLFLIIILKAIKNIRENLILNYQFWIGLIMLQFFVLSMTSGSYYSDPVLNCSIVLTLLICDRRIINSRI